MKGLPKSLTFILTLLVTASTGSIGCTSATIYTSAHDTEPVQHSLNINTAAADSLQALPGIGPQLATKIVEHRTRYGPFRKKEHLLIVDGISEKRYRDVEQLITTD